MCPAALLEARAVLGVSSQNGLREFQATLPTFYPQLHLFRYFSPKCLLTQLTPPKAPHGLAWDRNALLGSVLPPTYSVAGELITVPSAPMPRACPPSMPSVPGPAAEEQGVLYYMSLVTWGKIHQTQQANLLSHSTATSRRR